MNEGQALCSASEWISSCLNSAASLATEATQKGDDMALVHEEIKRK